MENEIKTSVIIPIYNTEKYLDECIQSVLNQTQKEIEIILVDDGSTDYSSEIVDQYEKEYENIIVIHQDNQKLGAARNNGYRIARGKYVYFLDSDDYIAEDLFEKCYACAEEKELDFVFFDAYDFCDEEDKGKVTPDYDYDRSHKGISSEVFSGKEFWDRYYKIQGIMTCAYLTYIRKEYIERYNLMFEPGVFYEDCDWIARMYINAKRVSYYPERLYYRRYRLGAITQSTYTLTHYMSAVQIFWKLVSLYASYEDLESRRIIADRISPMINRLNDIAGKIDITEIETNLINFIDEGLAREKDLVRLGPELYSRLFLHFFSIKENRCFENLDLRLLSNKIAMCHEMVNKYLACNYKLQMPIKIAIYGIGKMCDEIFDFYEHFHLPIKAKIKLIVTESDVNVYRGYPVYEIEKIRNTEFEHIIIASRKYAEEMLESLRNKNISAKNYFVTIGSLGRFYE